jgi:hypothetical protein
MFEHPEDWANARQLMDVYNITQQHTFEVPVPIVGPNTYHALVQVDAFRKLVRWHKKLSIGVGVVKDVYCTGDSTGMERAVSESTTAIEAVRAAGGTVDYLSMDEPWVSGREKKCGGPALEPTADNVAFYMAGVNRAYPSIKIGLIEAYPFSDANQIERMLDLLHARNVPPAFLHMDVDWHSLKPGEFVRDMRRLQAACQSRQVAFGIILTGYDGDADALFALDVMGIAHQMAEAFLQWSDMPNHIMLDSWVQTGTGLNITPSNLPESRRYTHTYMLLDLYRYLRGVDGTVPLGTAVPRR